MDPSEQALAQKRKGNEQFVKNNFLAAIKHYTNALDLVSDIKNFDNKQRSILYANKAECFIRLEKYRDAIPCCDSSLKYDSSNIKARFRRAKANEKLSKHKDCLKDLQFVIKKDSKNVKALELMRRVQRKLGIGTKHQRDSLLSYDPETDVTKIDQDNICKYNVLNHLKTEYEDELLSINDEIRGIDDAQDAVEMLLDEDACKLQIGSCFVFISNDDTEQYLKNKLKDLKLTLRGKKQRLNQLIEDMTKIRAKLKAKFGDHIGLPEIKPNPNIKR